MDDVLLEGCKTGDLAQVARALTAGADLHCYGDSPLYYAASRGHFQVVQHLWLHADLPRTFHVGRGTLRKAAAAGHTEIVRLLCRYATAPERAAAIRAADAAGQTATAACLEAYGLSLK
jgi:ankyrin repeat protein